MVIILALDSHSLRLRLGSCRVLLVEEGSCGETNTGISVCSSNVGSTTVCTFCVLCVYFLLAPPIPLGAWSMTLVLCQHLEYHYNYYYYFS